MSKDHDEHGHHLLTPRHIDNLVEALHALNTTIARAEARAAREHLSLLAVLQRLTDRLDGIELPRAATK